MTETHSKMVTTNSTAMKNSKILKTNSIALENIVKALEEKILLQYSTIKKLTTFLDNAESSISNLRDNISQSETDARCKMDELIDETCQSDKLSKNYALLLITW